MTGYAAGKVRMYSRKTVATVLAVGVIAACALHSGQARSTTLPHATPDCPASLRQNDVCHAAGYNFESVVFHAEKNRTDLPLVIALHWSSSNPKALLDALGSQVAHYRMVLPVGRYKKREGFSFFEPDFYARPLDAQQKSVAEEAQKLADFIEAIKEAYGCSGPIMVMGASQGGDLSFQLAHDHPELVHASFPLLGRNMVAGSQLWKHAAPVTAYYGLDDPIVDQNQANASAEAIREAGGRVEAKQFSANGHDIGSEMAAQLARDIGAQIPHSCKP